MVFWSNIASVPNPNETNAKKHNSLALELFTIPANILNAEDHHPFQFVMTSGTVSHVKSVKYDVH